mmetsp:Transcript_22980/g.91144  ORF Transcript_22980/g.91144 Transcript_22980/m.91144 type:complete len:239 (-) Transcript_22980:433-1149(-)
MRKISAHSPDATSTAKSDVFFFPGPRSCSVMAFEGTRHAMPSVAATVVANAGSSPTQWSVPKELTGPVVRRAPRAAASHDACTTAASLLAVGASIGGFVSSVEDVRRRRRSVGTAGGVRASSEDAVTSSTEEEPMSSTTKVVSARTWDSSSDSRGHSAAAETIFAPAEKSARALPESSPSTSGPRTVILARRPSRSACPVTLNALGASPMPHESSRTTWRCVVFGLTTSRYTVPLVTT